MYKIDPMIEAKVWRWHKEVGSDAIAQQLASGDKNIFKGTQIDGGNNEEKIKMRFLKS